MGEVPRGGSEFLPTSLHPLLVHFPVALILLAAVFDWVRWSFDRDRLASAGFWGGSTPLLLAALVGAMAAVASGLLAEESIVKTPIAVALIGRHETAAFATTVAIAVLTFWRVALRGGFPHRRRALYLILLVVAVASVSYGAYLGGEMVYGHGVGVGAPVPR